MTTETIATAHRAETPIVLGLEVEALQAQLGRLNRRDAVLLAADLFSNDDWDLPEFEQRLRYFLLLTAILLYKSAVPVVKIIDLMSPDAQPGPDLREKLARRANLLRAYTRGGFADLSNITRWIPDLDTATPEGRDLREIVSRIRDTLDFIAACLGGTAAVEHISSAEVFLALPARAALALEGRTGEGLTSASHALRTDPAELAARPDLAAYLRAVANPVLLRLGAPDGLESALTALGPGPDGPRVILDLTSRHAALTEAAAAAARGRADIVAAAITTFEGDPVHVAEGRADLRVGAAEVEAFCRAGGPDGLAWAGVGLAVGPSDGPFRLSTHGRMPGFAYHLIDMLNRGVLPGPRPRRAA